MAFRGNIREIVEVSQADLNRIAQQNNSIRVGSTKNPRTANSRANQYEREGYSGTMYMAKTTNRQYAEDRLLDYDTRHNVQKLSNSKTEDGYVYVINGKRFS